MCLRQANVLFGCFCQREANLQLHMSNARDFSYVCTSEQRRLRQVIGYTKTCQNPRMRIRITVHEGSYQNLYHQLVVKLGDKRICVTVTLIVRLVRRVVSFKTMYGIKTL